MFFASIHIYALTCPYSPPRFQHLLIPSYPDIDSDDDESEDRSDQMTRVAVTLLVLAEDALKGRFLTPGVEEDREKLRALGTEPDGERVNASVGGWHWRESNSYENKKGNSWQNSAVRTTHRSRLALRVRLREKNALAALSVWATHPTRVEKELLPKLRAE